MYLETSITLKQALEHFYSEYSGHLIDETKEIPLDVVAFFKCHDIVHVLFDCDITLYGEGSVKLWTIFGTTLGFWEHMRAYNKANAFELSRKFNTNDFVSNLIKLVLCCPKIIVRAVNMTKPWPWSAYESYLDTPISQIRKEFNIRVV